MSATPPMVRRLRPGDLPAFRALNALFGAVFDEPETYGGAPPTEAYVDALLAKDHVIALVAESGGEVVGGLVAYEFDKFERMRREVYIYDLGVAVHARRQGVATALIGRLRRLAAERGAWVVFVQADHGDAPAIALYEKLGVREEVLHFDIAPADTP
ncbi:MAG TPA: AAC(3)-I family aminoglycoside N-acetyltransferase [Beijerinckiaceae bacterium]|jgi:aminoglycoside 3-N-acetyltransferase I